MEYFAFAVGVIVGAFVALIVIALCLRDEKGMLGRGI